MTKYTTEKNWYSWHQFTTYNTTKTGKLCIPLNINEFQKDTFNALLSAIELRKLIRKYLFTEHAIHPHSLSTTSFPQLRPKTLTVDIPTAKP